MKTHKSALESESKKSYARKVKNSLPLLILLLGRTPAILTSNDFVRSNEIVRTKWPIY